MTGLIQIAQLGTDTGNFDLYSDINDFTEAFAQRVTIAQLSAGFASDNIPDGTKIIKVKSRGSCTTTLDIGIEI